MYAEKLLPHDLEAEEAVVGSLLIDSDSFVRVAHVIKPEDFYREKNQLCFSACLALFQRGEAIDQVTVARELSRTGPVGSRGRHGPTLAIWFPSPQQRSTRSTTRSWWLAPRPCAG